MGKQATRARIRAGEDTIGRSPHRVVKIFDEQYRAALKTMSPDQAAAHAHDAVQRHLLSAGSEAGRVAEAWAMQAEAMRAHEEGHRLMAEDRRGGGAM